VPNLLELPSRPSINSKALKNTKQPSARIKLSESPTTAPIYIPITPVLIHTCVDYAVDDLYLWASNFSLTGNSRVLELEIGGDGTFSDDSKLLRIPISKEIGLVQIYPGISHESVSIYARADVADHLNIFGYAIRHYRINIADADLGFDGSD